MYRQSALFVALCVFLQLVPQVSCEELGAVDYIAIALSLGITVFLVSFVCFYLWRARNGPPANKNNNITGRSNVAVVGDDAIRRGKVHGISLQYISSS